jgi:amino-acid N-acetyltransferase
MIRKARIPDVKIIHKLLLDYAREGLVLPRSLSELYETIREFYVFEENGQVVGTVCLNICWEDLAEVRSLAVVKGQGGKGIGRQLVRSCLDEARELDIKRVFTLTYKTRFFERLGFHLIEKSELPHKIWRDCLKCPKFPECDEIAMSIEL